MTGNANELAKSLIFKLENLKIDIRIMKEALELYVRSNNLDFTDYDKTIIQRSIQRLSEMELGVDQERLSLKILSGN